jgi:hypothetical protein
MNILLVLLLLVFVSDFSLRLSFVWPRTPSQNSLVHAAAEAPSTARWHSCKLVDSHDYLSLIYHFQHPLVFAVNPIRSVQVTLRGEVFYVSEVTTVAELQERLAEESGLDESQQGRVTFQGRVLEPTDTLSQAGVSDGAQVNMVPKVMADHWKMVKDMAEGLATLKQKVGNDAHEIEVLSDLLSDLTIKAPFLMEAMERFSKNLKHPQALDRANDPERIESLRQVILNNPMLMTYSRQTPGMEDALSDPDAWFRNVQAAIRRWQTMTGYQLWQALVDGRLFAPDDDSSSQGKN